MIKNMFLSYAKQDEGRLAAIENQLRQLELRSGNEVSELQYGTEVQHGNEEPASSVDIREQIKRSISKADTVVIVWTPSSAYSSWVNYEAGMADALGKQIIVVRLDPNAPALPAILDSADVQVVDFSASPA